jgi:polysaccharide export outer membrane protein
MKEHQHWNHSFTCFLLATILLIWSNGLLSNCGTAWGAGILATPTQSYRVGPNDVLHIEVFKEDDLTTEIKISGEGNITFPLLGLVHIGGLTVKQVETLLTNRLAKGYLKHPNVTLYIIKYRDLFIDGEVKAPGTLPYEDGLTVLKAVLLAGGFTENSLDDQIRITRVIKGEKTKISVDLDFPVQPDDLIYVPSAYEVIFPENEVIFPEKEIQ